MKAEEELKRERDLAQKYLDVAGVIMVALDKEGRVTLLNRKGCEVLECTLKEALGKNWFENFLPTRVRDKVWRAFQSLMEGKAESMEYYENPVLTLKGEERLIAWHNTVIRDSKGQIIGTLSSGKDITEQKKAEEALRESEEKFRAIATAAKDAIILTDDAGIVIYWNPAAERIFGYTKEEAAGKELHKLILPKRFHIGYKSGLANFKLTGEGVVVGRTFEGVAVRKDGTEFPVELSMSAFQMEDKWHAVTIIRDITERKLLEEELKRYSEHLERLVEERTRKLREVERLAAIGATAAMIGHDLRNPLQAIINTLYLTDKKLKSMRARDRKIMEKHGFLELRRTLLEQVEYMDKIISSLQDYARPYKPNLTPTSLHELVNSVLLTLSIPDNVEVNVLIPEDLPKVMVDPTFMKRVFTNLFTNALQAMPDGGRLTIRAHKTEEAVSISVEDTGVGIPEEKLDKIFTPLFTTKSKGIGLGLSICKRLLEAQGGSITVKSQVGKGSTFTLKIPIKKEVS